MKTDERLKHGVRAFIGGKLPASWRITKSLNALRAALESEVSRRRGEVDVYCGALIQSAIRHEGVAALWTAHLRDKGEGLTVEQKLAVCREIRNATDARDRCLKELGLNKHESADVIDAIYERATDAET